MIERKLPKEQYEMIPASFIREAIKGYNAMALREEDDEAKKLLFLRAEVLCDLLKSWYIHTVAKEPDVIEAAQRAYMEAVDAVSCKGESFFKEDESDEMDSFIRHFKD